MPLRRRLALRRLFGASWLNGLLRGGPSRIVQGRRAGVRDLLRTR